jgi:hypothetical protein
MIFYVTQPSEIDVLVTKNIITTNNSNAILGNLENYVACAIQGLKLSDVIKVGMRRGNKGTFGQIVWQFTSQSLALSFFLIYFEKALIQ